MSKYPILFHSDKNTLIELRPAESSDIPGLCRLLSHIPNHEKIIYRDDVAHGDKVEAWFINPVYSKNAQLVAVCENRIVAEGTLHSEGIYWPRAAEIKLIVHPEYRNMGIGRRIFNALIYEGFNSKFQKIVVRFKPDSTGFQKILSQFDFRPETSLRYYVEDKTTNQRKDLIIASFDLANWSKRFEYYRMMFNM